MNGFVDFFLKIRNSKFFNSLVISVILASALYAGVSSYDIPSNYIFRIFWDFFFRSLIWRIQIDFWIFWIFRIFWFGKIFETQIF